MREQLVETLKPVRAYPREQLRRAMVLAASMGRGTFLLLEPPPHDCHETLDTAGVCLVCSRRADD